MESKKKNCIVELGGNKKRIIATSFTDLYEKIIKKFDIPKTAQFEIQEDNAEIDSDYFENTDCNQLELKIVLAQRGVKIF